MALRDMSDNFPIIEGTLLASRYEVQAFLGEGSFGKVAKCVDTSTNTYSAIKITKDHPIIAAQALEEIKILKELQSLDPDECNFVRWAGLFYHQRFICLQFELLDLSLRDYMKERHYQPLSVQCIRPVLHQLSKALLHLDNLQIVHADLKPDNIMVVDRRQQPLRVKIIDFGLACHVSDIVPGSSMQTLWYRAPEVMLGTDFDEAIDMWSLGVFAAELTLGYPLFYGFHEYDVMRFIVETLGQPPDFQLNSSQNTTQFFRSQGTLHGKTWKLKTADEFVTETGHIYRDTRIYHLSSLDVLGEMLFLRNKSESRVNLVNCVDLLKRMLEVDQYARIIPLKVLEHAFFTVEQQPDGTQDRDISSLRANVEEETPVITEQPLPQDDSTASKTTTPHEEICFTSPENEKPEDEEKEAAHSQLEVAPQTSSKTRSRLKKFFSWFKHGKEFSHH